METANPTTVRRFQNRDHSGAGDGPGLESTMKNASMSLVVVGLCVALGCGQAPEPETQEIVEINAEEAIPTVELEGSAWQAVSIVGQPAAEGVVSTIAFNAEGQVAGNAGCNNYFGSWGVDGTAISFGHMGATQKMCVKPEFMEQEGRFLEALGNAESFAVEDGMLLIYSTGFDEPTKLAPAPSKSVVSGSVFYRERIALPPDAVITVKLVDVSRADAPAVVLAEEVIKPEASVPVDFVLEYDPAQIDDRMSYAVQARISSGDNLMFTTTEHIPVITRDAPTEDVQVLVHRVQ